VTTTSDRRTTSSEMETLREAQTLLTAAIQHAREESLDPNWRDQLLGLRLRLEKTSVAIIARELDHMEITDRG
jgi:hypothetical protein